jgi:hypothetical protein
MADDLLIGPRLKIERAYSHILDVQHAIQAYLGRHPYILVVDLNADKSKRLVKARRVHELNPMVGLIVADAIHNLRSSLDLLAISMARKNGIATTQGINFPFGRCEDAFESNAAKAEIKAAFGSALEAVKELKPYKGGNDLLWALHDLDRRNKHIDLVSIGGARFDHTVKAMFKPGTTEPLTISGPQSFDPLDQETIILETPNIGSNFNVEAQFTIDVAFGDVEPVKNQPVLATLQNLASLTTSIFSMFEFNFFKS